MAAGDILVKRALKEANKTRPDYQKPFELLDRASKKGNAEAFYAIGTW